MTAQTPAQRVSALRQRRQDEGLVRIELWVHPFDDPRVREYAARLKKLRDKHGSALKRMKEQK